MSFYPQKNVLNNLQVLSNTVANVNNSGITLYKLDVSGPKYESYIDYCKGIKEIVLFKKNINSSYNYFDSYYYCEVLKTKTSSVKKELTSQSYFFLTRKEAEDAFKEIQKKSIETLEKRIAYYQDLQDSAKQMSV